MGIQNFSPTYFHRLADVDYLTTIAAFDRDKLVAMTLWLEHKNAVYYHLGASNWKGYAHSASYACFDYAIRHFRECQYINFGGVAGAADSLEDGLAYFKRGFSNAIAPTYLCGSVLSRAHARRPTRVIKTCPFGTGLQVVLYKFPSSSECFFEKYF